jgi:hypothetical protein
MRLLLLSIALFSQLLPAAQAQRINFKTFVGNEAISLNVLENAAGLNFNLKQPYIPVGQNFPINIVINDLSTVVVEIDAPTDFDVTFSFSSDNGLTLSGSGSGIPIPFSLRYAYNNTGEIGDAARRLNAVEVPRGYSTVTMPMRRRTAGAPAPPPTPNHDGYVRPRTKAYVYVYGDLGPIPNNIPSGVYNATINLIVDYDDTTF